MPLLNFNVIEIKEGMTTNDNATDTINATIAATAVGTVTMNLSLG